MTIQGYVNLSVKPAAKRQLELLKLDLASKFGREVSLSEALELGMKALYAHEIEIDDPTLIDLAELTRRLGLEPHEQTAVLAWSGEKYGHRWTEAECQDLIRAWAEDTERIEAER